MILSWEKAWDEFVPLLALIDSQPPATNHDHDRLHKESDGSIVA